jgi:hypothetical protein
VAAMFVIFYQKVPRKNYVDMETKLKFCLKVYMCKNVSMYNTEPSIGAYHQITVHFGKAVSEKKIFRNQPI